MFKRKYPLLFFATIMMPFYTMAWNLDEYAVCVFKTINDYYNVEIGDGDGMDNHNYKSSSGVNWILVDPMEGNSEYTGPYTYASNHPQNEPFSINHYAGVRDLLFQVECVDQDHIHSSRTVNYHALCLWDETGNDTDESLGRLTPQSNWTPTYTEGILWHTNYHGHTYSDVDLWELRNVESKKTYCIEVKYNSIQEGKIKLELFNNNSNVKSIDESNVFKSDGTTDQLTYRQYFTLEQSHSPVVKISFKENQNNTRYKIALMKCKPVVLVHGLMGYPVDHTDSKTDFGDFKNFIGYINSVRPCVCLDFPWNCSKGSYLNYVGGSKDNGSLFNYLNLSNSFFHGKATMITYSTGGPLLYDQMTSYNVNALIHNAVMISPPFWGVHIAKVGQRFSIGKIPKLNLSQNNLKDLSRGSEINWKRWEREGGWNDWKKITVVIGTGTEGYGLGLVAQIFNYIGFSANELAETHHGDGVVAFHSANLKNKHEQVIIKKCNLGHDTISRLYLNNLDMRYEYFQDILYKINDWENMDK